MMLYDIFRFGFFAVFVGIHAVLITGVFLEWRRDRRASQKTEAEEPFVSVIIPVHNETHRMAGMLKTLGRQEYSNAEFIFIDDRSSDGSAEMLEGFFAGQPEREMRILRLEENPGPNFKQYALQKGIEVSRGSLLLFTDADCEIPPSWISSMIKRMADPRTGAALGSVFKKTDGKGFFGLFQCFEHGVHNMYLAASAGIGLAGGAFGNNMIVRRESLDAIGGYAAVPFSPTEDAALVSEIRSRSNYKIRVGMGKDIHIITENENNWKEFISQTLRWNNGGLFSPDLAMRFNCSFLVITISIGMLAIPVLPFAPSLWPLPLAIMLSMTANTLAILRVFGVSLPKKGAAYILQCLFTPIFFTFLTILGLCGVRPKWKGATIKQQR